MPELLVDIGRIGASVSFTAFALLLISTGVPVERSEVLLLCASVLAGTVLMFGAFHWMPRGSSAWAVQLFMWTLMYRAVRVGLQSRRAQSSGCEGCEGDC